MCTIENIIKLGGELKLLKTNEIPLLKDINLDFDKDEDIRAQFVETVERKKDDYILLFIKLLNNIHMKNAATVILDCVKTLCESNSFAHAFATISTRHENIDPTAPFLTYLGKDDIDISKRNFPTLGAILGAAEPDTLERPITVLIESCVAQLGKQQPAMQQVAVNALAYLMRNRLARKIFTQSRNGIQLLLALTVENIQNVQLVYEISLSVWLLSYNPASILILLKHNCIPILHDVLRNAKKEKCLRVAILALQNLAKFQRRQQGELAEEDGSEPIYVEGKVSIFSEMLGVGMLRTLDLMARRNFGDNDISTEVKNLLTMLEKNIEETSSFVDYRQEVLSGRLDWTPVHKSEKFWKENIKEFERDEFKILKDLANLLNTSKDIKVLTIICHDLGEFVKYHPQGRKIVNSLDVKSKILTLMNHENEEVNKQALLCIQKIMVQKWEFLSTAKESG